jgi:LmbE family N-acetylglucosaminyl deacetylase
MTVRLHVSLFALGALMQLLAVCSAATPDWMQSGPGSGDISSIKRALVMIAHPDDLETIAGGLVAKLVQENSAQIRICVVTSGQKGFHNLNETYDPNLVAMTREKEQQLAAQVLGVQSVTFLRYMDGEVEAADPLRLKRDISIQIREWRPDLVITFSPYMDFNDYAFYMGLMHSDHRTVGLRTLDAVYPQARDFTAYPDLYALGLQPWNTPWVYLFSFTNPSVVIDIAAQLPLKTQSLLQHKSQYSDPQAVAQSLQTLGQLVANHSSMAGKITYAEGYTPVAMLP